MTFDKEKFKRLVHYIVWKAGNHDGFGATKLNKVLWFADARAFILTGSPITGATYTRQKFGPVPKEIMPIRTELVSDGAIQITKHARDFERTQFRAITTPDMSIFSDFEMQTANYWIEEIDRNHTAASISDRSHDYAWEIAKQGEELPLNAFRVSRIPEPSEGDLERLRQRAEELGLG